MSYGIHLYFQAAITSYILLAGCGGGGTKGMKYTGAWLYKCQQILSSLNNIVDLLYEGLNITGKYIIQGGFFFSYLTDFSYFPLTIIF